MKRILYGTRMIRNSALMVMLAAGTAAFAQGYGFHGSDQGYQGGYQQGPPPPPPGAYGPGGWDQAPPPQFREVMQRGYRDGVDGARKDFENHRSPNVRNRDEYRRPDFIAPPDRRDYKMAFRRGYDNAVRHMYGPPPR